MAILRQQLITGQPVGRHATEPTWEGEDILMPALSTLGLLDSIDSLTSGVSGSTDDEPTSVEELEVAEVAAQPTQPFLRWAGGKRWILHHLPDILGRLEINRYHEPFLGGGAVFLGSDVSGQAYLSDLNAELIEAYQQVRDDHESVAEALKGHANTAEHYYAVRAVVPDSSAERAARFIYLNHTSYNGIYRVNLKGQYNVPFGHRAWGGIPSKELLSAVSLKLQGAVISVADFEAAIAHVQTGDLVFLDPPYTAAHNNNGFVKYNQRLFSFEDQIRLSKMVDTVRESGAYYLLTNAAHESIATLFEKGDTRLELKRGNSVGGHKAKRGSATEYVFTNVPAYG
jgi:DNA adenine methylase